MAYTRVELTDSARTLPDQLLLHRDMQWKPFPPDGRDVELVQYCL